MSSTSGSEEHCKLYCWECLLLQVINLVFGVTGFANLSCKAAGHLQTLVLLRTFGEKFISTSGYDYSHICPNYQTGILYHQVNKTNTSNTTG